MRFTLTIDVPDNTSTRPGIAIAQIMREMTPTIENANPLDEHGHYVRDGVDMGEWQLTWPEPQPEKKVT